VRCHDPLEGFLLSSGAATRTDRCASDDLVARLRELSLAVDSLWNEALNRPGEGQALEIGEASQGLHRAMIALVSFLAGERLRESVVESR
jgi:hypothetical protein